MRFFSRRQPSEPAAPGSRQAFVLRNGQAIPLEVTIEVNPDRYILWPGDRLEIFADTKGEPFDVAFYEGGVQIYAGMDGAPPVRINGEPARSDWVTELPPLS
jgi:hypothetical protein